MENYLVLASGNNMFEECLLYKHFSSHQATNYKVIMLFRVQLYETWLQNDAILKI